jgi:hypothetical protein
MSTPFNRRRFVAGSLGTAAVAGLGDFAFLQGLPAVAAAEARPTPKTVQLDADTEPLVRLIEETPRDKLLEKVAAEIRRGTNYQQLLGAVFLAGVRGIRPRPVGFKFHAVLVINSAHLASLAATDNDRWLPLFWALDNFKVSQATNQKEGGWMMPPADEAKLPPAHAAKQRFIEAMDDWDEEGADRAVTALARTAGATEVIELLWRYGARDFRDIGHKAIYVANAWRTLQAIGWRHAEPVLRSLAFALLEHEGGNPAERDAEPDLPFRENLPRAAALGPLSGREHKISAEAAADLLSTLRTANAKEGSKKVAELLRKGVHPDSVWDGLFLTAGELLGRQPGIVGIHCVTSANALHYAYQTSGDDQTRQLMMLQAAAFLTMFRGFMSTRGKLGDLRLDDLQKVDKEPSVEDILAAASENRLLAARKTLTLVEGKPDAVPELMAAARRLVFSKGRDSHDYKFSSAALEDYYHLTPAWRARFAASSLFNLRGSGEPDTDLLRRARAALS